MKWFVNCKIPIAEYCSTTWTQQAEDLVSKLELVHVTAVFKNVGSFVQLRKLFR